MLGTWDPDSDDSWDRRLVRIIMNDKKERAIQFNCWNNEGESSRERATDCPNDADC